MSKVKHIVLLKFKEGTTEEQTNKFFEELLDLSESVPGVDDYVSGACCNGDGRNQGMTHGFIMTFTDAASRDAYMVNPEHDRFKTSQFPLVDNVLVFDFEV